MAQCSVSNQTGDGRGGGYTHMLGQAAAMLIPFPTATTAKVSHGTLTLPFDQRRTFAGATVAVLHTIGVRGAIRGRWCSGKVASDRRRIMGDRTIHALREIRRGSHRTGLQRWFTTTSSTIGRHRRGSSSSSSGFTAAGILDGGRDRSSHSIGSSSSGGGDTLATRDTMVGIDGSERNRVRMVSLGIGMGERPGERQFLFISQIPVSLKK